MPPHHAHKPHTGTVTGTGTGATAGAAAGALGAEHANSPAGERLGCSLVGGCGGVSLTLLLERLALSSWVLEPLPPQLLVRGWAVLAGCLWVVFKGCKAGL